MSLLNQTLTSTEKQAILQAAVTFGNEYHILYFRRPQNRCPGKQPIPTGAQAVPTQNPYWPTTRARNWNRKYLWTHILEYL